MRNWNIRIPIERWNRKLNFKNQRGTSSYVCQNTPINIDRRPRTWELGKSGDSDDSIIMIRRMGWKITNYERNWRSREKYIRHAWKYRDIFQPSLSIKGYFNTTIRCAVYWVCQIGSSRQILNSIRKQKIVIRRAPYSMLFREMY